MPVANRAFGPEPTLAGRADRIAADFGVKLSGNVPQPIRDALRIIHEVAVELVATGHLKPKAASAPVPYWQVVSRLFNETEAEFDEIISLYRLARAASDTVRPLQMASEKLLDALGMIQWRAENAGRNARLEDTEVMRALVMFRDAVWMQAVGPWGNQALKSLLFRLDQIGDQIRDRSIQILLDRLWRGEMTAEEGAKAVAVLKQAAETGQWRDPEGDLDRLVTEQGFRHDRPAAH